MTAVQEDVSIFARMVDKLRTMSEAELKLAYKWLFLEEIVKEWEALAAEMNFGNATDEDINNAISEIRYGKKV